MKEKRSIAPTLVLGVLAMAASSALAALSPGERTQLTETDGVDARPTWSPDGKQLAFVSARNGEKEIWVMNADGTGARAVTNTQAAGVFADEPSWSPAGNRIAFTSNRGDNRDLDIWVLDLDTGQEVQVTTTESMDWMPSWSPDGKRIAFVSNRGGEDSVWVIDADGSNATLVARGGWDPAWAPDGRTIAFYSAGRAQPGVYVAALSGGPPMLVLEGASRPTYDPQGERLCVVMARGRREELWLCSGDGSWTSPLPNVGRQPDSPAWSPDGKRIAFDAEGRRSRDVFVTELKQQAPTAQISSPQNGARVKDTVTIRGTAMAPYSQMRLARLEYGPGGNPTDWRLIGEPITRPVRDDVLGRWDTNGLTGTFTLRLRVVDVAGDYATDQVTVHLESRIGVEFISNDTPKAMTTEQETTVHLKLANIGTMSWLDSGRYAVQLSYRWLDANGNAVIRRGERTPLPHAVSLGETVDVAAKLIAPHTPGEYQVEWDLLQGEYLWFSHENALTLRVPVSVVAPLAMQVVHHNTPSRMTPSQEYTVDIEVRNDGASIWRSTGDQQVGVGYQWRDSTGNVIDHVPYVTPVAADVAAGETARVPAIVKAPDTSGHFTLEWRMRLGRDLWFGGGPKVSTAVDVQAIVGVEYVQDDTPGSMAPGEVYVANLKIRNAGSTTWPAAGATAIEVAYRWLRDGGRQVSAPLISTPLPYDVPAAQAVVVSAQVQAPAEPGTYTLEWDLRQGADTWLSTQGSRPLQRTVIVARPTYSCEYESPDHPTRMTVGQPYSIQMTLRNKGSLTWAHQGRHRIELGYHWLDAQGNELTSVMAPTPLPKSVPLGDSVTVAAQTRAPDKPGRYILQWDLFQEGQSWFSQQGASTLNVPVVVEVLYGVEFLSHDTPREVVAGQTYTVTVRVRNTGNLKWESAGAAPVQLSYMWLDQAGNPVVRRGLVANLPKNLSRGEEAQIKTQLRAPETPGTYILKWDMLQGGLLWFAEKGTHPLDIIVRVK